MWLNMSLPLDISGGVEKVSVYIRDSGDFNKVKDFVVS